LSSTLLNVPVMSLRLGAQIGTAMEPIINPHNLKILGWWCKAHNEAEELVLLSEDVRQIVSEGLVVNDVDALASAEDLARHKDILDIHFELIGKSVRTKDQRLGKVEDYSYNDGMFVQKLYIARPLVNLLNQSTLIIDRTQILEVTDHYILVKGTEIPDGAEELAGAPA